MVDTLGDHTPPKRTSGGGKRRRPRLAYLSNLAVAAAARRHGIGGALLRRSEQVRLSAAVLCTVRMCTEEAPDGGSLWSWLLLPMLWPHA